MPLRSAGIKPARMSEDLPLPEAPITARKEVSFSLTARFFMSSARPKKNDESSSLKVRSPR
jgi:hypothetical protein